MSIFSVMLLTSMARKAVAGKFAKNICREMGGQVVANIIPALCMQLAKE